MEPMARYRRALRLRPVMSIKHIVDGSATLAANTKLDQVLVKATENAILTNTADVLVGSTVSSIFLKLEVSSNEAQDLGAIPNFYMYVIKNPANELVTPTPNNVGANDKKKFVIHQEMIMMENTGQGGNPRTVFAGVIKIPRGYRRFGYEDQLQLVLFGTALNTALCFQCIYKEFR